MSRVDAVVVGSGPNGLAAAITIARTGRKVIVFESARTAGGGCRSEELTRPGFVHDVCSAVHPFAVVSPFFGSLDLSQHGLDWISPPVMLAHPIDDARAACLHRSVALTAHALGSDAATYERLFAPMVDEWPQLVELAQKSWRWPTRPLALARFGLRALQPVATFARRAFASEEARALFAGVGAHAMLPLERRPTAGVALMLALAAHVAGWCIPRGGARTIAEALVSKLRSLGGEVITGHTVASVDELPPARAVLCDLSPRPLLRIAGHRFPPRFRRALERYRYGMGVYKVDWALDAPIPWRHPECALAGTLHLGGTLDEIAAAERDCWRGRRPSTPFVLLSQPTLFDPTRAPAGKHVVWTYCHVPQGFDGDMLAAVERQIERFAPGFRDRVLARATMGPAEVERRNANFAGGDIGAGALTMRQFVTRPTWRTYATPVRGLYLCSASTPPGPGVHGMCGYFAARRALAEVLDT